MPDIIIVIIAVNLCLFRGKIRPRWLIAARLKNNLTTKAFNIIMAILRDKVKLF